MKESVCRLEKAKNRNNSYRLFSIHPILKNNREVKIKTFWNKIIISIINIDSLNTRLVNKTTNGIQYYFNFESKEVLNNGFYDIIEIDDDSIEIVFL